MNRKLLLLNLILVASVAWAVVTLRTDWRAAKQRESATLNQTVKPVVVPKLTPAPLEPPVRVSGYLDIAQKLLLHPSRNPDVPIEPPPPPPPKPPMPALPVFHGLMNLGEGPTAILSVNATAPHQAIHPGEPIGQFKLVDVNSNAVVLEWNGEVIRKTPEELANRQAIAAPQETAARTDNAPPQPAAPPPPQASGPGETTNFGFRTCSMNDGHNEGDVVEGYRKVVHNGPFGKSCTYDPAK